MWRIFGTRVIHFPKVSSIIDLIITRKIIGFDTFNGFPHVDDNDTNHGQSSLLKKGALKSDSYENLAKSVDLFDINRPLNHINKIELIEGDICETASDYVKNNPHLIVSLLYLDLDLYKPTLAALKAFAPLVPKGGLIVFDELNLRDFPGETLAFKEYFDVNSVQLERSPLDPAISYVQL